MYKLGDTAVDLDLELRSMVEHISARWDNVQNLRDIFTEAHKHAAHAARFRFNQDRLWSHLIDRRDARKALLKRIAKSTVEKNYVPSFDQSRTMLDQLALSLYPLCTVIKTLDRKSARRSGPTMTGRRVRNLVARAPR